MSFLDHACNHGLVIVDLIADGRWHRTSTVDKPRKKNGAYCFDGARGVVINFATMVNAVAWRDGGRTSPVDRSAIRKMQMQGRTEENHKHAEARVVAASMIGRATFEVHPYLAAKGFPRERGLVLDGELLIPMRDFSLYKQLNSVQRIAADGSKLFLPGGKAKGSVFLIGPYRARESWLCEGYATGLSLRAALDSLFRDAVVVVCFSAGNLVHVGQLAKDLRGKCYVAADNDKSGAGEEAAMATRLPYWMSPVQGEDFNDFWVRVGTRAAAQSLRQQLFDKLVAA